MNFENYNATLERPVTPEWSAVAKKLSRANIALEEFGKLNQHFDAKELPNMHDFVDFKNALQLAIKACEQTKDETLQKLGRNLIEFRTLYFAKKFDEFSQLKATYEELSSIPEIDGLVKMEIEKIQGDAIVA